MSKVELLGTSGGYNISGINENFQTIEDVLNERVLFRDNLGNEPNMMNNHLDMNGFLILNCPSLAGSGNGGGAPVEGGSGTDGYSNVILYAYKRSATLPATKPGNVDYDFTTHSVISPVGNDLGDGWMKTIPEGNDPLYVCLATASSQGMTDQILSNEWTSPVILSKDGVSAINSAMVFAYQRTPTDASPALPSNPCTYVFSTGVTTGLNNGWTSTIPPSFNGKYLWATQVTAASATNTDTIAASEWSAGQKLAQDGLDGQNGGANGLNNATFYAYKRAGATPTDNPGDVTYAFGSASITTPSTDALANGWFKKPPAGSDQMYMCVASASASTATDSILAAEWTAPAAVGANGLNSATLYVYQRTASATPPVAPSATVTYDFTTKMITGLSNNWSAAIPDAAGGKYLWVTTATAASLGSTDTIPNTEWAAPNMLAQDGTNGTNGTSGTDGVDGQRGTVQIAATTSGSVWSSSQATTAIANAGYGSPVNRDIVTLYNPSTNFSASRFYDNGIWTALTSYIDGNLLVTGTLSASKISADTMTGQTYQTAASGKRITINSGGDNMLKALDASSNIVASIGGTAGHVYVKNTGSVPGIQVDAMGTGYGIAIMGTGYCFMGSNSSQGTSAQLGSSYGGYFQGGIAVFADGIIQQTAYAETSGKGIKSNNVIPVTDNTYFCGTLAARWAGVTSSSALVVSSDARLKSDVVDSPLGLSFINNLRPVAYRLTEGHKEVSQDADGNTIATPVPGVRKHYGLIAQEVKQALTDAGQDDAAFWLLTDKDDPTSQQALRYEELISPLIAAVKELSARVVQLEGKVNGG